MQTNERFFKIFETGCLNFSDNSERGCRKSLTKEETNQKFHVSVVKKELWILSKDVWNEYLILLIGFGKPYLLNFDKWPHTQKKTIFVHRSQKNSRNLARDREKNVANFGNLSWKNGESPQGPWKISWILSNISKMIGNFRHSVAKKSSQISSKKGRKKILISSNDQEKKNWKFRQIVAYKKTRI